MIRDNVKIQPIVYGHLMNLCLKFHDRKSIKVLYLRMREEGLSATSHIVSYLTRYHLSFKLLVSPHR